MGIMTLNEVVDPASTASPSDRARAHAYRAHAFLGLDEPERARAALQLAISADPSFAITAPPFSAALVKLSEAVRAPGTDREAAGAAAENAGDYQVAFVHYLAAYEALPDPAPLADDRRVREKIVTVVGRLKARPAIPAAASDHYNKATQLLEAEAVLGGGGTATAEAAAAELERAISIAPWWPEATFKLAGLQQKLQRVDAALVNLNLYRLADPEGYAAATAPKSAATPVDSRPSAPRPAAAPAAPPAEPSVIYFYRTKAIWMGTASGMEAYCNGARMGDLRNGRYFAVRLDPGEHTCYLDATGMKKSEPVTVRSGDELYFQTDHSMTQMELKPMSKDAALAAMRKLKASDADRLHDSRSFIPTLAKPK
jgi:tetratricopeptide (TPR) repeat protein